MVHTVQEVDSLVLYKPLPHYVASFYQFLLFAFVQSRSGYPKKEQFLKFSNKPFYSSLQ